MFRPDLNLLFTLDVLLAEGSVARAARRLRLSPSAMSRALARLRATTGDPLLVRAGRGLVPSPRAIELRQRVSELVHESEAVLRPAGQPDLSRLQRTFTLRTREGFAENFGAALLARVRAEAPQVRLRFVQKLDKDSTPLREGRVELETGVVGKTTGPELRAQSLFTDRFVGVVRRGHPLSRAKVTASRYAAGDHVGLSREGREPGLLRDHLGPHRSEERVVVLADSFSTALALARDSDLIATVPERHTGTLRAGLHSFPLPFPAPEITVSLLWHPRHEGDPAHRWLRDCVRAVVSGRTR